MATRHGIRLTLGGAPAAPHVVAPLRGYYRPDFPTPVGQEGDVIEDLDEARSLVKDRSDALELVEIPAGDVKGAEAQISADLAAGRNELPVARRDGRAKDNASRTKDEANAVKKES